MPRPLALFLAVLVTVAIAVPATAASTAAPRRAPTATANAENTSTLLVKVAKGADAAAVHAAAGAELLHRIRGIRVDVVAVPSRQVASTLAKYSSMGDVVYAEPNRLVSTDATPNDPNVGEQYGLRKINAGAGWSDYGHLWRQTGGARIAIIDTGIDMTHMELGSKVVYCRSFLTGTGTGTPGCQDSQVHGTHVAGIAAAIANNDMGIAGVAFDAPIMSLQVLNSSGYGFTSDVAAAIVDAARNGAKVANYSLSAPDSSRAEQDAVEFASEHGVVQVAAAGNTGARGVQYPAKLRQVIAVSATNRRNELASYSTVGDEVEVAAPGSNILSTVPGTLLLAEMSGTSMASPHVAGLAALLRAEGYGRARTREIIRETATDLGPAGRDEKFGYGLINVARAIP
jgi:thermitase